MKKNGQYSILSHIKATSQTSNTVKHKMKPPLLVSTISFVNAPEQCAIRLVIFSAFHWHDALRGKNPNEEEKEL